MCQAFRGGIGATFPCNTLRGCSRPRAKAGGRASVSPWQHEGERAEFFLLFSQTVTTASLGMAHRAICQALLHVGSARRGKARPVGSMWGNSSSTAGTRGEHQSRGAVVKSSRV